MESVFYRRALSFEQLSISDALVYSFLVYRSLVCTDNECYDLDGNFTMDGIMPDENGYIIMRNVSRTDVANSLNIAKRTAFNSISRLREFNLICYDESGDELIYIGDNKEIIGDFFPLEPETELKGLELVVYSYLKNKCKKYVVVDKFHKSIANELYMSRPHLEMILTKLEKAGRVSKVKKKGNRMAYLRAI